MEPGQVPAVGPAYSAANILGTCSLHQDASEGLLMYIFKIVTSLSSLPAAKEAESEREGW